MDLWIRSQDREVFRNANHIKIEKHNDKWAIVELATVYGYYETKERALEVLDDIQNHICINLDISNSNYQQADLILKCGLVEYTASKIYEMPKE